EGFAVIPVRDGSQTLPSAAATRPDVILLELTLPEIDGFEVCRRLRADRRTAHMPVMLLSEAVEEPVKVLGFEVGANDFLTRPFGLDEFTARVKSLMRRVGGPRRSGVLSGGSVELDLDRYQVSVGGHPVTVTARQLALLCELMSMSGIALRRSYLHERMSAGGNGKADGQRTIDSLVARLRSKLGSEGRRIVTVRGVGYRFDTSRHAKPMKD
ncbi:MAG: response regulator transcription factor, partial [Acidobacteria bacterium]|nr:response regulator transcription factor [Acidobacteriota bacterium]